MHRPVTSPFFTFPTQSARAHAHSQAGGGADHQLHQEEEEVTTDSDMHPAHTTTLTVSSLLPVPPKPILLVRPSLLRLYPRLFSLRLLGLDFSLRRAAAMQPHLLTTGEGGNARIYIAEEEKIKTVAERRREAERSIQR